MINIISFLLASITNQKFFENAATLNLVGVIDQCESIWPDKRTVAFAMSAPQMR